MGRTLIIAPWGQPAGWKNKVYVSDGVKVESCTSLSLVVEKFRHEDFDVAILALDSLVDEYGGQGSESKCYACYEGLRNVIRGSADAKSYTELRENLTAFLKQFIECLGLPHDSLVVVCPAVGNPGGKWRFVGAPSDFEALALHMLGKKCAETDYTRIVLDLSHGINFMPAVTLKLANWLISLILAAHGGDGKELENGVELQVYNSDPSPPTGGDTSLNVNLIARNRVKTIIVPHQLSGWLLKNRGKDKALSDKIKNLNTQYRETVQLTLSAVYYPLPLALCEAVHENMSPIQLLKEAFDLWCQHITIGSGVVERPLEISSDAVYALLLTEAVRKRVAGMGKMPTLEDLRPLAKFYKVVNESFYYLIMDEKHRIERKLFSRANEWVSLSSLYGDEERTSPDKRIMIAHAGLQKELVEINIQTRQLRYREGARKSVEGADLMLSCI